MVDENLLEKYKWFFPPEDPNDVAAWDKYWMDQVSHGFGPLLFDIFCHDRDLIQVMFDEGMKNVLCAANGMSQEPKALAVVGFQVVALDFSSVALKISTSWKLDSKGLEIFCDPKWRHEWGHLEYVVGNILDPAVCPGPFDVIIERRTSQLLPEEQKAVFLEALAKRLSPEGILFCHSHDARGGPFTETKHFSRTWFDKNNWNIWNGGPGKKPKGQVAWLQVTSG